VLDAVWHLGVRNLDMPVTSAKLWEAIQAAQGGGDGGSGSTDAPREQALEQAGGSEVVSHDESGGLPGSSGAEG
jgi:hypothetical protein